MQKPNPQSLSSSESEFLDNFSDVNWESIRHTLDETSALLDTDDLIVDNEHIILRQRAEQLAQMAKDSSDSVEKLSILTFRLGAERYALPVTAVRSISELRDVTPIPCVPEYYRGITNLQGKLVSVLDLMTFLGVDEDRRSETASHPSKKMMIVAVGADLEIGLMVEQVDTVTEVSRETLINVQSIGYDALQSVSALTPDGLILLDIEQLYRDPRIRIYEEAG